MKSKSISRQEMNNKDPRRLLFGALFAALGLFQTSCSTSSSEAWAKIQSEGLIPYLAENEARMNPVESAPRRSSVGPTKKKSAPTIQRETPLFSSGIVTAQSVRNRPGFVYSPHTTERLMVDVSDYKAGMRVRCPYTKKSFIIPGQPTMMAPRTSQPERLVASTPVRRKPSTSSTRTTTRPKPRPKPQQTRIASQPKKKKPVPTEPRDMIVKPKKEEFEKMAVVDELPIAPPTRPSSSMSMGAPSPEKLALPKKEVAPVPVGKRVPGKPNYVYSPFASSNQVVDVEGHSGGTKVKCPYTGKVFAVPAK